MFALSLKKTECKEDEESRKGNKKKQIDPFLAMFQQLPNRVFFCWTG